jgi:hypothetical protein
VSDPVKGQARGELEARILDLSEGGARLELPAPLAVGEVYGFALRVGGETVSVQATVRRCQAGSDGRHEVAVEFVALGPQDKARLSRYLDR